jgi:hypothetical protein
VEIQSQPSERGWWNESSIRLGSGPSDPGTLPRVQRNCHCRTATHRNAPQRTATHRTARSSSNWSRRGGGAERRHRASALAPRIPSTVRWSAAASLLAGGGTVRLERRLSSPGHHHPTPTQPQTTPFTSLPLDPPARPDTNWPTKRPTYSRPSNRPRRDPEPRCVNREPVPRLVQAPRATHNALPLHQPGWSATWSKQRVVPPDRISLANPRLFGALHAMD